MQNLKIKVNNPAESERAQRAFFALGGVWPNGEPELKVIQDGKAMTFRMLRNGLRGLKAGEAKVEEKKKRRKK